MMQSILLVSSKSLVALRVGLHDIYIACDSHAYLFSEDGSVISRKLASAVFKWSGI